MGSLSSFFVCRDTLTGDYRGVSTWLPSSGAAGLGAFLAAGFHTQPCASIDNDECEVCSWLMPNSLPTPALASRCRACLSG